MGISVEKTKQPQIHKKPVQKDMLKKASAAFTPLNDYINEQSEEFKNDLNVLEAQGKLAVMISNARKEIGLTQQQLAEKLNIKRAGITRIESGDQNLSFKTLYKIAEALGKKVKITIE